MLDAMQWALEFFGTALALLIVSIVWGVLVFVAGTYVRDFIDEFRNATDDDDDNY